MSAPSFDSKPRPRQERSDELDAKPAAVVAPYLGLSYPTQFNLEREKRQLVLDPLEGLKPYPARFLVRNASEELRREQQEFDRAHHLVVVEWGGEKPPGRSWTYSLRQCQDVQGRGLMAALEARRKWGLPTVSGELEGRAHRRRRRSRCDKESVPNDL